jgi:hypothetical protein
MHAEFLIDKMTQLREGMRQKPRCKLNRVPEKATSPCDSVHLLSMVVFAAEWF